MNLTLKVKKVTLLQRSGEMDTIYIHLDEETSKGVHGEYLPYWHDASLKMDVTEGRGEEALKALGVTEFETIKT